MSENNDKKMPPVEPEIAANIINYYSNYSEGHVMDLRIRDISRRLLHEEMVPPNHPVLNAIVDMHQPLQVKDYPALVNMFEKLGVYGWPPHDPLIYRDDEPDDDHALSSQETIQEEHNSTSENSESGVPLNEDGLTPQEEIEQYVKQLEEEDARNNKGRTTQEQTKNRDSYKKSQDENTGKSKQQQQMNGDNKDGRGRREESKEPSKSNKPQTVSIDPVQAAFYQFLVGINGLGTGFKKAVVNPVTGVSKRVGRSDLNGWFDTKIERFESAHSEVESLLDKISSPDTSRSDKDSLLESSKRIFENYANKFEDISEFSDKKIGLTRKQQLKDSLNKAKIISEKLEDEKDNSEDSKKLFENVQNALKAISDLFKRIFSRGKDQEAEPAP